MISEAETIRRSGLSRDAVKYIAMATMFCNHFATALLPGGVRAPAGLQRAAGPARPDLFQVVFLCLLSGPPAPAGAAEAGLGIGRDRIREERED